jgi:murein DD-endopeptidase MepM/ murein hydrolase activator NlpD
LAVAACASTPPPPGSFVAPLSRARVSSPFGEIRGRGRRHYGVDLRARHGTPVAATVEGRVAFAGWRQGFGRLVIVEHSGELESYYAHLSDFAVRRGERVATGQVVGFVGESGNATGPHLHFEMRERGRPIDPSIFVRF